MDNIIQSYLISLGAKVDQQSFKAFQSTLDSSDRSVSTFASTVGSTLAKSVAGVAGLFASAGFAISQFTSSIVENDMQIKRYAQSLWITEDQARRLSRATDALGASFQEIALIPALRDQFNQLNADAFAIATPGDFSESMDFLRDVEFQFTRLSNVVSYTTDWIAYYLGKNVDGPLGQIRQQMSDLVDSFITNAPTWGRYVAQAMNSVLQVIQTITRVGSGLYDTIMQVWDAFPQGAKIVIGALTAISAFMLAGPVGQVTALLTGAILLIDDYFAYIDGRKSSRTLAPVWERVQVVIGTISTMFDSAVEYVSEFLNSIDKTAVLEFFSGALESVQRTASNLIDVFSSFIGILGQFFSYVDQERAIRAFNSALDFSVSLAQAMYSVFDAVVQVLGGLYSTIENTGAIDSFSNAFWTLEEILFNVLDVITDLIGRFTQFINTLATDQTFRRWGEGLGRIVNSLLDRFTSLFGIVGRVTDKITGFLGGNTAYTPSGSAGEGQTWVRKSDNVNIEGLVDQAKDALGVLSDWFFQESGERLFVTSARDGSHAGGEYSHDNGWKFDVAADGAGDLLAEDPHLRNRFIDFAHSLGLTVLDEYEGRSADWTGGHLDVSAEGFQGVPQVSQTIEVSVNVAGTNASPTEIATQTANAVGQKLTPGRAAGIASFRMNQGVLST